MSGNMSKAGLTKDLEAIASVGIGGVLLFNITQGIPNGPISYNSPEHHAMLTHAAKEAERLGLTFGVHNCDGWSASGGPWVTPEQSMKMVVWREQLTQGGEKIAIQMPQPTTREGFYRDISVVAYPSLPAELQDRNNKPTLTASDPDFDLTLATDARWEKSSTLKQTGPEKPWIQYAYAKPQTIRSLFMLFGDRDAEAVLLISDDGTTFKRVHTLRKVRTGKGEWGFNDNVRPVTARYFRLQLNGKMTIKEATLSATYAIDNQLGRTAMGRTEDAELSPIGEPEPSMIIDPKTILDLTAFMNKSGLLQTELPPGNWTILRFGYTATGASNNPASAAGKGLEVDKLSRAAFKIHYDAFVKKVVTNAKPLAPNAFQYVEIDSYEMGGQNWTDGFMTLFNQQNGYDLRPFMPLLAGKFVASAHVSEQVLGDFRSVVCNLMTENYFGYFRELCHRDGLKTYIEPYGFGPLNDLDVGGKADMVMGEFWMNRPLTQVASAVSAAHIYGTEIISAESFTSDPDINWKGHPGMAKLSGDKAWAAGINEFMFHRFAHQANTHVEPGMTMNRWGFHVDRTQTWWANAGAAWFRYIARGSYLLRQGVPVSDLLIFVGDGSPNSTVGRRDFTPNLPRSIGFDCVNADVLLNRIRCDKGELVLPEGTRYKAVVLANSRKLKLSTLRRLHELARQGVVIIGPKPVEMRGYSTDHAQQEEFAQLVEAIWKQPTTDPTYDWHIVLKKRGILPDFSVDGQSESEFMHRRAGGSDLYFLVNADTTAQTLNARFRVSGRVPELWNPMTGEIIRFGQFTEQDGVTRVPITLQAQESVFVVFREHTANLPIVSSDKTPGLQFAVTPTKQLEATVSRPGTYPIRLRSGQSWMVNVQAIPEPVTLSRPWQIQFNKAQGFGGTITTNALIDWAQHASDSVRHYSGTAAYTTTFTLNRGQKASDVRIQLDLGTLYIVAAVTINGKQLGVGWMPPFVVDITDAVQVGENKLVIQVTNQWSNRLIGEERYPANDGGYQLTTVANGNGVTALMPAWYANNEPLPPGRRTTFTTAPFYKVTDSLMPSGLVGPVMLQFAKRISMPHQQATKTHNPKNR